MDGFLHSFPAYYSLGSNLYFLPDGFINHLKKGKRNDGERNSKIICEMDCDIAH